MENNIDSKQTALETEAEIPQSKKVSSTKSNLKFACTMLFFLAVIVYLIHSLKEMQNKYDHLARKVSDGLEQITKDNRDIQRYYNDLAKIVHDGLELAAKENKECIARSLQVEYEIKSNSTYAADAMKLAEKALAENDYELAKVYVLNAINHIPHEIKYIEAYFQLLEKQSPTQEELKRFADILDMSVFQIAPVDIQRIIAMKSTILQKMEAISLAEHEKSNQEYQRALTQKINSLLKGELSLPHIIRDDNNVNIDLLSARIETIKAILEESVLEENETAKWNAELAKANIIFQLAVTLSSVENATSKADATTAKNSPAKMELVTAQNQLQTANALLAQIWTMDCSAAPDLLVKAKEYQARIGAIDAKIREIGSQPAFKNIKMLVSEIQRTYNQSYGLYTSRIKTITQNVD